MGKKLVNYDGAWVRRQARNRITRPLVTQMFKSQMDRLMEILADSLADPDRAALAARTVFTSLMALSTPRDDTRRVLKTGKH